MTNSAGFSVTRTHSGDRFYNPPAVRRHRQMLLQQQQEQLQKQLHKPSVKEGRLDSVEVESRTGSGTDSDESAFSRPTSVSSASPPRTACLTNLDRLMESVTPFVRAQYRSEARRKGWKPNEADKHPFFVLEDLWESFAEWSVYGLGVPLLLNGSDSIRQYYVPYLSGIQLYADPKKLRRSGDDSGAESSRDMTSARNSDREVDRRAKGNLNGMRNHRNLVNVNSQKMSRLTLVDKPLTNSSNDDTEVCNSKGVLVFEYFEQEQPHFREALTAKVSSLASQFPDLNLYRSCDLSPSSWVSVAWYPIYRIPMGQTLQSLDTSFLTFHSLSTDSRSKINVHRDISNRRKINDVDAASTKISLPVFGLASYKLKNSIVTPNGGNEWQQAHTLMQAADNWLRNLQANLPDFKFFASHSPNWK